ncbi:hypothetical protein [Silicimonas algicola]|uniref:Uncharacterized protein n=1 Tax=Silicimonas algicola TaxID=1826607 RepID=A0A316G6M6_9RHOB|nr:hypothetical protein [Silicimonas algicola]PWK56564.1 hypothetical protein C8D95_104237 [Silicimonas algicola]
MKDPFHSPLDYPEAPRQENKAEADDPPFREPGTNRFSAVLVVITIGFAVAYIVGDL